MSVKVAINGYGTIGKRVAEAVSRQDDMQVIGVSKTKPSFEAFAAQENKYPLFVAKAEQESAFNEAGISIAGTVADMLSDADIVVDCTATRTGLAIAMQMVRPRGTIVMKTSVAPNTDGTNIDLAPLVIHEIKLIGSRCGSFPEALEALSSEKVDVLSLISRRMKLSDGPDALRISTKSNVIKVLLEP